MCFPLDHRILLLLLASLTLLHAEETPAPPGLEEIRNLLGESNGDLATAAQSLAGKDGGNTWFYFPTRDEPATPADWGFKYENLHFRSIDGTPLHGWFVTPKATKAKGTIVFSHGNAGSLGHHLGFVMWLAEAGYNVMMYDYRGFGKSGGNVDRRGMIDDVKAAFAHVMARKDIDRQRIVSYGHSLGGAQSITALAEAPVAGLKGIIVDGAFASYQTMARVIAGQLGASLVSDELAPKDYVAKLPSLPLLVVHGKKDEIVPFSQGRQLFDTAKQPKTLFAVEDGRHGTALSHNNGAYRKKLITWLSYTMDL